MDREQEQAIVKRLLNKSKEIFALAVELYNRPTLKYHAESCSIFLCNAWELMLKAYLIRERGSSSIYYPGDSERTIALIDCLKKIFTNSKDPLRANMDQLIKFRNLNTHFITDEYEIFIGPFIQKAVENYADKLLELHGESIADLIPENRLILTVRRGTIDPEVIRTKYDPHVAEKLLQMSKGAAKAAGSGEGGTIAAIYETNFRVVKKEKDADLNVFIDSDAKSGVAIIKDIKDPVSYFPFTPKQLVEEVNRQLKKKKVEIQFKQNERDFNMHDFNLFVKVYEFKGNERYSWDRSTAGEQNASWTYSKQTVNLIVQELLKNPSGCLDNLKKQM